MNPIIYRSPNRNDQSQQNKKRVKILHHPDSKGYLDENRTIQAIWPLEDQPTDEPCFTRLFRDRWVALQKSWNSCDLWDRSGFVSANEDAPKVIFMRSSAYNDALILWSTGFVVHRGCKGHQKGGRDGVGHIARKQFTALMKGVVSEVKWCQIPYEIYW